MSNTTPRKPGSNIMSNTAPIPKAIERLNPDTLFDPTDLGFCSTVVTPAGARTVYIAGKLADDHDADFDSQVAQSFENLRVALEAGGASLATVVKITCLIVDADSERIGAVSQARRDHFGTNRPTSTIIPVPRLVSENALFEIDAIAIAY